MKEKIFAIINVISFFGFIVPLELSSLTYFIPLIIVSAVVFTVSLLFSLAHPSIWKKAHSDPEQSIPGFYRENYKALASILVSSVVLISIVGDFVDPVRDLTLFTSRVVIYLAIFMPCFFIIFKGGRAHKAMS